MLDMEKCGLISTESKGNICTVEYCNTNYWIEYLESQYTDFFERVIFLGLQKNGHLAELQSKWPAIQEEMRPLCFVWMNEFMGYNSTMSIEGYFQDIAYYDSVHNTEWDYFPEGSKFNGITYGNFTDAIIDAFGYAAKHVHFAGLLQSSHPELLAENLFYNIRVEDETVRLIQENRQCSEQDARTILSCMSLSSKNCELYSCGQVNCAPLIKISRNQYLHSVAGSLFHPFSFLLSSLQQKFPKDVSRNINLRENVFRKQLYEIAGEKFKCINRNIIIKCGNKTVTDIDAAMVDKSSGEIALFQLKWQNQTVDSIRSLHSKALNYAEETMYWVKSVKQWIEYTSEAEIAGHLGNGIKGKHIDKSKIFLFVLGRNHGNYSGEQLVSEKTVWLQWYQLLYCMWSMPENFLISELFNALQESSTYRVEVKKELREYHIDPYTIIVKGPDNEN